MTHAEYELTIAKTMIARLTEEKSLLLDRLDALTAKKDAEIELLREAVVAKDEEIDALEERIGYYEIAEDDEDDEMDAEVGGHGYGEYPDDDDEGTGECPGCRINRMEGVIAVLWNRLTVAGIDVRKLLADNGVEQYEA
jgi:hypothetical protein